MPCSAIAVYAASFLAMDDRSASLASSGSVPQSASMPGIILGSAALGTIPANVRVRMRGATPPNVYNLSLRERLFHGVRAIRLTPLDSGRMYGRDGMLAHSYMHGSNGQSNGCVAFRNYPDFLNAFLKGGIARLVVVERLENPPSPNVASGSLPEEVRTLLNPAAREFVTQSN